MIADGSSIIVKNVLLKNPIEAFFINFIDILDILT